jgi:hydroxypyruvate isomerase
VPEAGRPPVLSVCVEFLFADEDPATTLAERVRRAAEAGAEAVEMWGWRGRDLDALKATLGDSGVSLHAMTMDPLLPLGDLRMGAAVMEAFARSVDAAHRLGCERLIVTSGDRPATIPEADALQATIEVLGECARRAERCGITILFEPLNRAVDHPRCAVARCAEALAIIEAVDQRSLCLLYDFYHGHLMGDPPQDVLQRSIHRLGHVQIADVPGRGEPGSGAIDWALELGWLFDAGYSGTLGLEFHPTGLSSDAFHQTRQLVDAVLRREGQLGNT